LLSECALSVILIDALIHALTHALVAVDEGFLSF